MNKFHDDECLNWTRREHKLIIQYGDNINIKIFDGQNAYKRAKYFQENVTKVINI